MKPFRTPSSIPVTYRAPDRKLVRKHGGSYIGGEAVFATVGDRQLFEREYHGKF